MTILHHYSLVFSPLTSLLEGSDGMLYGISIGDGFFGNGTIFRLNKDGSGFALLHQFDAVSGDGSAT